MAPRSKLGRTDGVDRFAVKDHSLMKKPLQWYERFVLWILSLGLIPHHVAIILDGNRRWARDHKLEVPEGHGYGQGVTYWIIRCLSYIGVKEATLYLMSTHNITSRSEEELNSLYERFRFFINKEIHEPEFPTYRHHFIGDFTLLPPDLRPLMVELELKTRNNTEFTIHYAMGYSSRHSFTRMVNEIKRAIEKGVVESSEVDHQLLKDCLDVWECPSVDLLIRTSGERRLSDFLLWQCAFSINVFEPRLLADLNIFDLVRAILTFQYQLPILNRFMAKMDYWPRSTPFEHPLLRYLRNMRVDQLNGFVKGFVTPIAAAA